MQEQSQQEANYTDSFQISDVVANEQDLLVDNALRPQNFEQFIGQSNVTKQLSVILDSAKKRGEPPEHLLFAGPPGLGKTTLSMLVASELQRPIKITSGPSLTHAGDLASILSSITEGEVLFIDEIHRMSKAVQEMLYVAMEDFRVDIVVGKGVGASSINLPLPLFTVVGATTRTGLLPNPLKDRFGWVGQMDYYSADELQSIISRSAKLLGVEIDGEQSKLIATRSRGTARIANRILKRVRDAALTLNNGKIDTKTTLKALELFQIDNYGLDSLDQKYLKLLVGQFAAGPVGLSTIAAALGEEMDTIEQSVEPFLMRDGFIIRTNSGRVALDKAKIWFESNN